MSVIKPKLFYDFMVLYVKVVFLANMPKADFAKWAKAEEITQVISFLCSSDVDKINGAVVQVYGMT